MAEPHSPDPLRADFSEIKHSEGDSQRHLKEKAGHSGSSNTLMRVGLICGVRISPGCRDVERDGQAEYPYESTNDNMRNHSIATIGVNSKYDAYIDDWSP